MDSVILTALATLASAFIGWVFGRRKQEQDVISAKIGNMVSMIELYKKNFEECHEEHERTYNKLVAVQQELTSLPKENLQLRQELDELRAKTANNDKIN